MLYHKYEINNVKLLILKCKTNKRRLIFTFSWKINRELVLHGSTLFLHENTLIGAYVIDDVRP